MKPEQILCPHCGYPMRMRIDSYVASRVHVECWSCGVRGPRQGDLQQAIAAFLSMFNNLVKVP